MIATSGRSSKDSLPRLGTEGAEAPEFQVLFSRPESFGPRPDSQPNSFRWSGSGTIHIMERGVLIIARRRSLMAFHTTQERFVPAAEICDVYREGNSVRVDLRGELQQRDYFRFWTADTAVAGTIVRLLPTTRTIEYDSPAPISARAPQRPPRARRRTAPHTYIPIALVAGFIAAASFIAADKLRHQAPSDTATHKLIAPAMEPGRTAALSTVAPPRATAAQIEATTAYLRHFDDRMDGLRAQFRMAFYALQTGSLPQQDFAAGIDRWLLPQWRTLYNELASSRPEDGSLNWVVRENLLHVARGWERALDDYVIGLNEQNYTTVLGAFDRMSAANDAQRKAWSIIEDAQR
ncbi:MAG: hypothetical protein ACJ8R9_29525 [Steroidobacteraceae bacterium]